MLRLLVITLDVHPAKQAAHDAVATLPADLVDQLQDATIKLASHRLKGLTEEVAAHDVSLATELEHLADRFEYRAILKLLGREGG